MLKGVNMKH